MPTLKGSLVDVSVSPSTATEVQVRAAKPRVLGQKVVLREPARVELNDGQLEVELAPGDAYLTVIHAGRPQESIPLRVVDGQSTIGEAVRLADESWGEFTPSQADTIKNEVIAQVAVVEGARDQAEDSARAAKTSEEAAKTSQDAAKGSEDAARESQEKSATAMRWASDYSDAAKKASEAADTHRLDAQEAAQRAQASEGKTLGASSRADTSAAEAKSHADRAEAVADSTTWDGDQVTINGRQSPHLTGPKGEKGEPGKGTSWNDLTDVPMAESVNGPGLVTRDDNGWIYGPGGTPPGGQALSTRGYVDGEIASHQGATYDSEYNNQGARLVRYTNGIVMCHLVSEPGTRFTPPKKYRPAIGTCYFPVFDNSNGGTALLVWNGSQLYVDRAAGQVSGTVCWVTI